jgi:hypothetical protein
MNLTEMCNRTSISITASEAGRKRYSNDNPFSEPASIWVSFESGSKVRVESDRDLKQFG